MTSLEEAREIWELTKNRFQEATPTRIAYMGDGRGFAASNMIVTGKPILIYARESPDSPNFFVTQNRTVQPAFNKQVILGFLAHEPGVEQVLDFVTESVMYKQGGSAVGQTVAHRQQHEFGGGDEVFIDPRLFIAGLGRPTEPISDSAYVTSFSYYYNKWNRFSGGDTIDITRYNPTSGSRYVLVSLDPTSNELTYTLGNEYTIDSSEFSDTGIGEGAGGWGKVPAPAGNEYPLFAVALTPSTSAINWQDTILNNISDTRLHITPPFRAVLDRLGALEGTLGLDPELTTMGAEATPTSEYIANAGLIRGVNVDENVSPTDGQSLVYLQAKNSWSPSTITGLSGSAQQISFTIGASNTWNNELIPVWQGPNAGSFTLTEMNATASGTNTPLLSFNLQRRDFGAMNSAGVDIFAASQVADTDGLSQVTFATSVIAAKNHLMFTTGSGAEGGSVNYLAITLYYTR